MDSRVYIPVENTLIVDSWKVIKYIEEENVL